MNTKIRFLIALLLVGISSVMAADFCSEHALQGKGGDGSKGGGGGNEDFARCATSHYSGAFDATKLTFNYSFFYSSLVEIGNPCGVGIAAEIGCYFQSQALNVAQANTIDCALVQRYRNECTNLDSVRADD